ncbi:MAG: enterotoxin [Acidobacteriaceae bacterium]
MMKSFLTPLQLRPISKFLIAALFALPVGSVAQIRHASSGSDVTLHAGALSASLNVSGGHLASLRVHDAISRRTLDLHEAFILVLKDKTELRSTAMRATALSSALVTADPHRALRGMQQNAPAPASSCWHFTSPATSATFDWCLILRPGSDYARELLRINASTQDLPIAEVRLLDFSDPDAHVDGTVKGSPVIDANMYFGFEHPLSLDTATNGDVRASLFRDLPLRAGQNILYSAVVGTSQPGQLRRSFLAYIEAERPRPYRPFLHYNSWYDLGYENRFGEAGAIDRINAFGKQLVVDRHVQLDSFLFDDGWDNPNSLWGFDSGFPNGFTKTGEAATKFKAGIGVWLSPWGGYAKQHDERIAYGRAHGYEIMNNGFALSGPKYYQLFQQTCLEMIDKYHVNQFKFDGTGNADRVFPGSTFDSDFDAAIHLIERLRQQKPSIFINLTTGTTASPFWLFYADSIWRGGDDHDFSGVGTQRQRWITYRDAQTYKNIVQRGPLFPINSLMLHGLIYAQYAKDLSTDPHNDFADEVHSYFGTGTQLQEMYITPSLLTKSNWDTLAEAARWSRAHAATLKDVHWIGGDPDQLQVYGWAAWSSREGILTLRNPSTTAQTFDVDVARVFQLQHSDATSYKLRSVWKDTPGWASDHTQEAHAGEPLTIHLAPFEVLTLDAAPVR